MRKLFLTACVFLMGCQSATQTEPETCSIFAAAVNPTDLNERQRILYDYTKSHPSCVSIAVYKVNPISSRKANVHLKFSLDDAVVEVSKCVYDDGRILLENEKTIVILSVKKTDVTGLVYFGKALYSVRPIGDDCVVICRINRTKLKKDK